MVREHNGWKYRLLRRLGSNQWTWEILLEGKLMARGEVKGSRLRAAIAAQRAIKQRTHKTTHDDRDDAEEVASLGGLSQGWPPTSIYQHRRALVSPSQVTQAAPAGFRSERAA
jgi:hypothetical protein